MYKNLFLAAVTILGCFGTLDAAVLTVTSDLELRLKAADLGLLQGQSVSSWADSSGNSGPTIQPTVGLQPTYQTSGFGINNQPSVRFDGLNDYMTNSSANLNVTGDVSIFVAMQMTTSAGEQGILGTWLGGTGYYLADTATAPPTDRFIFQGGGGTIQTPVGSTTLAIGQPLVLGMVKGTPTGTIYTNGAVAASNGSFGAITSSASEFHLANINSSSGLDEFNGYIAEVLIYSRALNSTEIQAVNDYFAAEYLIMIPEPSTVALGASGGFLLVLRRRAQRRNDR